MDADLKMTLRKAVSEIRELRNQNQLQGARLDMFDKIHFMFTSTPQSNNQGYTEDIAWQIDKILLQEDAPTSNNDVAKNQ